MMKRRDLIESKSRVYYYSIALFQTLFRSFRVIERDQSCSLLSSLLCCQRQRELKGMNESLIISKIVKRRLSFCSESVNSHGYNEHIVMNAFDDQL